LHKGPENQVKHFLRDTLQARVIKENGQDVSVPPIADVHQFGKQLRCIKPTRKLADGRWPKDPDERPSGWMKLEEHQKSAIYCFPTAFADAINKEGLAIAEPVSCIHRAVYIHGSQEG
jgi:hypothetical protein